MPKPVQGDPIEAERSDVEVQPQVRTPSLCSDM